MEAMSRYTFYASLGWHLVKSCFSSVCFSSCCLTCLEGVINFLFFPFHKWYLAVPTAIACMPAQVETFGQRSVVTCGAPLPWWCSGAHIVTLRAQVVCWSLFACFQWWLLVMWWCTLVGGCNVVCRVVVVGTGFGTLHHTGLPLGWASLRGKTRPSKRENASSYRLFFGILA